MPPIPVKQRTKGIILCSFMGGILLTSLVVIAIPSPAPVGSVDPMVDADFPTADIEDNAQMCGTGEAQSGRYVTEYKIPSDCTQPLAIDVDDAGQVWFAQTTTGRVAKFNPLTGGFVEYTNAIWPQGARSMMWGMDHDSEGNIWFVDATFSSIWRFSTADNEYVRIPYPSENSLLQRIAVAGDEVVVNDFQGSRIIFVNTDLSMPDVAYRELPSPVPNSLTGSFDVDSDGNIWYTNWVYQQNGVLVRFDQAAAANAITQNATSYTEFVSLYPLPADLTTPNGLTVDWNDNLWIADTSSSYFFMFDAASGEFTQYVTSDSPPSTYGNASGIIHTTVTRPYWTALDDQGRLVFNEQTGNRIAVFDPRDESLVEYMVPSKNPHWGDCGDMADCGLAQVFGFAISGDKIWFTEWAENNIGVVDTSVELPFSVDVAAGDLAANAGQSLEIEMQITPMAAYSDDTSVSLGNPRASDLRLSHGGYSESGTVTISVDIADDAAGGTYKILVGAQDGEVAVSKFVTLKVPPRV